MNGSLTESLPPDVRVCVTGMWHLGLIIAAGLAELGFHVVGVDRNPERIAALNQGASPIFEPGLDALIDRHLTTGLLEFTTDLASASRKSSHVWIAFDTAVNEDDESDLSLVWETVRELAPHLAETATVLVSSQVPVGICEQLWKAIQEINPAARGGISYVPENLRLGHGLERFRHPEMIVIGANDELPRQNTEQLLGLITAPKLNVNLRTAEMVKHAINAFLATTICLINELGQLGDSLDVDTAKVGQIMRLDSRIGPYARVNPGLGFSGGTLARDLKSLQGLGASTGCATVLVDAVLKANASRNHLIVDMLATLQPLPGARIGVLGLTYTANTSTLRRSAALEIIRGLQSRGATVKAYDPKADYSELSDRNHFEICPDALAAATDCDALIVLTDWDEFRDLDYGRLGSVMHRRLLIDVRNFLNGPNLVNLGFEYFGIGRGQFAGVRRQSVCA